MISICNNCSPFLMMLILLAKLVTGILFVVAAYYFAITRKHKAEKAKQESAWKNRAEIPRPPLVALPPEIASEPQPTNSALFTGTCKCGHQIGFQARPAEGEELWRMECPVCDRTIRLNCEKARERV